MKFIPARKLKVLPVNTIGVVAFLLASTLTFLVAKPAYAAPFTTAAIVHSRLAQSTVSSATNWVLIVAKTASGEVGGQSTVVVTFGADYTVGTAGNFTVTNPGSGNCPSTYDITGAGTQASVTSWPGIGTASNVTSQAVTFPSTALSANTVYGFCITGTGLTNPANSNVEQDIITANADSSKLATNFISNDQVSVSATVNPYFTFALSGNTDNFSPTTLSTGSINNTSGITATVTTNAATGYSVQVKDANQGIKSTVANKTITSTHQAGITTLSAGTEGYGLAVTSKASTGTAGTGTIAAATHFDTTGGSTTNAGDLNLTAFQDMAFSNGTSGSTGDTYIFKERAAISNTTAAATDYVDTITVVGSGNF
jgi:hypothetical protein